MQKANDIIQQGVQKILAIACNDPDRRGKASTIAQEMVAKTVAASRLSVPGKTRPTQSITKAAKIYHSSGRASWIAARMYLAADDQVTFIDTISPWFSTIMSGFTPLQAKILDVVLQHYHKGASGKEIARLSLTAINTTSSVLSRLAKADIVQTKKNEEDRRQTIYYVADINWLRVHALSQHIAFRNWLEGEHITASKEDTIDRFITWCMEIHHGI